LKNTSPIAPGQPAALGDGTASAPTGPPVPQSLGEWFRVNRSTIQYGLVMIIACIALNEAVLKISYVGALMVIVGLGLIIFIHELGHFLVAKWCDVHVTTFSVGFGPALPFCSYTWGETTYKLAVFPLGGYVQMVGQVDLDETSDGSEEDPRSYKNKSVWQRMAIISAGVVMNAIFACVAFTAVFLGPGNQRLAANVWAVDSGKPAFVKGLHTGDEIINVNGIEPVYFEDLKFETMASLDRIEITIRPRGSSQRITYDITPHQDKVRMIGISPSNKLQLVPKKMAIGLEAPVYPNSAASKAEGPFDFDDVVIGVTNPDDPNAFLLPADPRNPDGGMKDFFEFQRRLSLLAGKEVIIRVERGPQGAKKTVDIKVLPTFHKTLGVRMKMGQIVAVREQSAAAKAGVLTPRPLNPNASPADDKTQKLEGDIIESVEVKDADGKIITFKKGENLDPVRLPYQLKQWAEALWKAKGNNPPTADRMVKLELKRQSGKTADPVFEKKPEVVELEWDMGLRFDHVLPMALSSPQAIPELGLAYLIKNEVDGLDKSDDKSTPLQKDDEITDILFVSARPDGTTKEGSWAGGKLIKGSEWASLFWQMQSPEVVKIKVKVKRTGSEEIEITPRIDDSWPVSERGLIFAPDNRIEKADNVVDAIALGFRDTFRYIMQVYFSLRGLIVGKISVDNLGGPVAITTTAYRFAQMDFGQFVFFLGLISVNLAVINFLPIPVLDGGHMVFLMYEKLRGKPASEGVRVGATYAGLLILGCLMIFVLFLDIRRLVGG